MALPKLDTPTHVLTLPSTGEEVKYRPFLVKEQKLLIMVEEGKDEKELYDTLKTVLNSCTFEKLPINSLPMFDIEYLFLKIRAKSVGSKVTVRLTCPDDEKTEVPVEIDVDTIEVQMDEEHTNVLQITDDIKLVMQYPIMQDVRQLKNTSTLEMFKIINKCVKEIHHGETVHNGAELSTKEVNDFFESMIPEQFAKVNKFFDTMPRLRQYVKLKNPNTDVESEVLLEGLESFLA